jgi:beta-lactam-binding protein with PASTA domain
MLKFITDRPLWFNLLAGLVLALIIFIFFIFSLKWLTHHDRSKTVPSVTGKTFEEAEKILDKAGFEVEIQDSVYVDTAKPLKVIKQVPEGDDIVKINRTVYLTINRAVPPTVEMPNIVGYSYRSAEMVLKNMNLRIGDTIYKTDFAKNSVLEQHYNGNVITPGTKIRMGSAISLVLGNGVGIEKFIVPQIVGMTFGEAKILLEAHGIGIGSIIGSVDDTLNSYIYKQEPERFNEDKKFQYIRSGQLMSVWLQLEKPVTDSTDADIDLPLPE